MRINVHSHIMPKASQGSAGAIGPMFSTGPDGFTLKFGPVERNGIKSVAMIEAAKTVGMSAAAEQWYNGFSDPHIRLAEMDEKGIDILGVTMSPIIYGYFLEPDLGRQHARRQNEAMAEYCDIDRARLFFMATLPMQDPKGAADEVRFATSELGAKAINIAGSLLGGRELDAPEFEPIWQAVADADVPVFIHPSLQMHAGSEEVEKWAPILGYPYQSTVAFTTVLLSGILDRFPHLKFYFTHGGGFVPYQFGRIERMAPAYGYNFAKRPLREYLPNFFFDVLLHDVTARRFLVEWAGPEQVIVGDNYDGIDSADGFAFLDELGLGEHETEMISSENAVRLFRLDATARAGHATVASH
jgi:aminocarboxymuconate-semialdehyde decarboxylase